MIKGVAFEGGGSLGVSYAGAVRAIEEHLGLDWDSGLEVCSGTSAGSLVACAVSGYLDAELIRKEIETIPWNLFQQDTKGLFRDLWHFWSTGGWHRVDGVLPWIEGFVKTCHGDSRVSFMDVYDDMGLSLHIDAVDELEGGLARFSRHTTPDMRVADAIMASISIPFWFPAYRVRDKWYSDGGLLSNHPVDTLRDEGLSPDEVVGFRLDGEPSIPRMEPPKRPIQRAINLVKVLMNHSNKSHVPSDYWPRIVRIDTGRLLSTDFNITRGQRTWLMEQGYAATSEWLRGLDDEH